VWKLDTPATANSEIRRQTQQLIAEPFTDRPTSDLVQLLEHEDMRVRLKAQFHLVDRGAAEELLAVANESDNQLARIHALWGIGQLSRRDLSHAQKLVPFLQAEDAEVRAQAAKLLGDVRYAEAADQLVALLADAAPRARFFAAEALGRIGYRPAVQPIVRMLAASDGEDVYLRQAGATALARIGDANALAALADHPSRAVRVAAVMALRRLKDPADGGFLQDEDAERGAEAGR